MAASAVAASLLPWFFLVEGQMAASSLPSTDIAAAEAIFGPVPGVAYPTHKPVLSETSRARSAARRWSRHESHGEQRTLPASSLSPEAASPNGQNVAETVSDPVVVVSGYDPLPVQPNATDPAPLIGGYGHTRAHLRLAAAKFPPITMCERKSIARDAAAVARAMYVIPYLPSSHVRNPMAIASHQEWTGHEASHWWSRDNSYVWDGGWSDSSQHSSEGAWQYLPQSWSWRWRWFADY